MKTITLSADEHLIEAAQKRAHAEHTTLDEQFQCWLAEYTHQQDRLQQYDGVINLIRETQKYAKSGGKNFTRDEMNER